MRVARIFNTFGPRMHMNDGRVVSNFILQALQAEPMTVSTVESLFRAPSYQGTPLFRAPSYMGTPLFRVPSYQGTPLF